MQERAASVVECDTGEREFHAFEAVVWIWGKAPTLRILEDTRRLNEAFRRRLADAR